MNEYGSQVLVTIGLFALAPVIYCWAREKIITKWRNFLSNPTLKIGDEYLWRWHLIPRNRFFNIYLHKFIGSDDRIFHDHPWNSVSILLKGQIIEETDRMWSYPKFVGQIKYIDRREPKRFKPLYRKATHMHRLEVKHGPVWTLFVTGPKFREWGFLTDKGWIHWEEYLEPLPMFLRKQAF